MDVPPSSSAESQDEYEYEFIIGENNEEKEEEEQIDEEDVDDEESRGEAEEEDEEPKRKKKKKWDGPISCPHCPKMFRTEPELKQHARVHTGEKPYKCETCGRAFGFYSCYHAHKKQHGEKKYACDQCDKKFAMNKQLNAHKLTHNDELKYKCSVCCQNYKTSSSLRFHMMRHTGECRFFCDYCGRGFIHQILCKQHEEKCKIKRQENRILSCVFCGVECRFKKELATHEKTCPKKHEKILDEMSGSTVLTPAQVLESFRTSKRAQPYPNLSPAGFTLKRKKFLCDKCPKEFVLPQSLENHKKKVHDEVQSIVSPPLPPQSWNFMCSVCRIPFKNKKSFHNHEIQCKERQNTVNGELVKSFIPGQQKAKDKIVNLVECSHCSRRFSYEYQLKNHLRFCASVTQQPKIKKEMEYNNYGSAGPSPMDILNKFLSSNTPTIDDKDAHPIPLMTSPASLKKYGLTKEIGTDDDKTELAALNAQR